MPPKPILPPTRLAGNGPAAGEQGKHQALAQLEATRQVYVRRGRRALLTHLLRAGEGTIDDVRSAVPIPASIAPKLFGAVPGPLAEEGIITATDFIRSRRPEAHARPVTRWVLADRAGALRWLARHPDLPDPEEPSFLGA